MVWKACPFWHGQPYLFSALDGVTSWNWHHHGSSCVRKRSQGKAQSQKDSGVLCYNNSVSRDLFLSEGNPIASRGLAIPRQTPLCIKFLPPEHHHTERKALTPEQGRKTIQTPEEHKQKTDFLQNQNPYPDATRSGICYSRSSIPMLEFVITCFRRPRLITVWTKVCGGI